MLWPRQRLQSIMHAAKKIEKVDDLLLLTAISAIN
jgi:hypothetical protein